MLSAGSARGDPAEQVGRRTTLVVVQAALRRAGVFRRRVERPAVCRAERALTLLRRRVLLARRLLVGRLARKARPGFALRLLFVIFAI